MKWIKLFKALVRDLRSFLKSLINHYTNYQVIIKDECKIFVRYSETTQCRHICLCYSVQKHKLILLQKWTQVVPLAINSYASSDFSCNVCRGSWKAYLAFHLYCELVRILCSSLRHRHKNMYWINKCLIMVLLMNNIYVKMWSWDPNSGFTH